VRSGQYEHPPTPSAGSRTCGRHPRRPRAGTRRGAQEKKAATAMVAAF